MKITLNSNNEIHRKIAKLFVGCSSENFLFVGFTPYSFIGNHGPISGYRDDNYSITIDLDTAEPDLRMAIGEAMEFDVTFNGTSRHRLKGVREVYEMIGTISKGEVIYENKLFLRYQFNEDLEVCKGNIKLSREWLESQGVEVSE